MYSFLKNQRNYSVTLEKIYLMQKKAVKEGQIDKKDMRPIGNKKQSGRHKSNQSNQ